MKKALGTLSLLPMLLSLSSCADLVIKDVNMLWTTDARQVQARVKNEGSLSAGAFGVSFEVSGISEQQVGKAASISTVQQLGVGDSELVNADFSTLATPENGYLNESRTVKIVVEVAIQVMDGKCPTILLFLGLWGYGIGGKDGA